MSNKHMGFKKTAEKVARKEGISLKQADRYVAVASRNASPAAKRKNPRLKKV